MKDQPDQIPRISDLLESGSRLDTKPGTLANPSASEFPLLIQEIVDTLQPLLTPYEATIYWYLFRHSIAASGSPHLRVGHRRLCRGVIKSARSGRTENPIAPSEIQEILRELESIGAIRKEGEPNREGTPYRILVPNQIEACMAFRRECLAKSIPAQVLEAEIDYYNVPENRLKIYERDNYKCIYCRKQLDRSTATLDHIRPVAEHGGNDKDNLVTSCLHCNSRKQKRAVGDFLAEN